MGRVGSFRDLRVYREAVRLALEIFRVSATFPAEEQYDLVRQIRRSSRSVCANTAEAWRRRRYPASLVAKLVDAEAEATETRVHIEIAVSCGYMDAREARRLDTRFDVLIGRLASMRARPDRWTPRPASDRVVRRGHSTKHTLLPPAGPAKPDGDPGSPDPAANAAPTHAGDRVVPPVHPGHPERRSSPPPRPPRRGRPDSSPQTDERRSTRPGSPSAGDRDGRGPTPSPAPP